MAKIFISTDYHLLNKIIGERKDQKGISLLKTNDLIYFNDNLKTFQVEKIEDANLFLVKDIANSNQLSFAINKESDYLMRHSTCNHNSLFQRIHSKGEHEVKNPYYTRVFDIIFDDESNKANRIIEFLFDPTEIAYTDSSTSKKTIQEVQDAYRNLYKKLTFDYLKYKNEGLNTISGDIRNELNIVSQYYGSKSSDENVKSKLTTLKEVTTLESFYHLLQEVHPDIEKILFAQ